MREIERGNNLVVREIERGNNLVIDRIICLKMDRPKKRRFLGTPKKEKLEEVEKNVCTDDVIEVFQ